MIETYAWVRRGSRWGRRIRIMIGTYSSVRRGSTVECRWGRRIRIIIGTYSWVRRGSRWGRRMIGTYSWVRQGSRWGRRWRPPGTGRAGWTGPLSGTRTYSTTRGYTVLKCRTFSVVNHWVLRGHCDRLRNFLTLSFVINFGRFGQV